MSVASWNLSPSRCRSALVAAVGLIGIGMLASSAHATPLFTTQDDWGTGNGWSGENGSTIATAPSTTYDADLSAVNGVGNFSAPNGVGTPGSLQVNFGGTSFGEVAAISGENGNSSFISVLDPGTDGTTATAYSGTLYLYYTLPSTIPTNGYFQLGIEMQYAANGYYQTFFPAGADSVVTVGTNTTGQPEYMATIPYTMDAGAFNGFGFGIIANTNAAATTFYVDDLSTSPVSSVPEPASLGIIGAAGLLLARRSRR